MEVKVNYMTVLICSKCIWPNSKHRIFQRGKGLSLFSAVSNRLFRLVDNDAVTPGVFRSIQGLVSRTQ